MARWRTQLCRLKKRSWRFHVSADPKAKWRANVLFGSTGKEASHTPLAFTEAEGEGVVVFPEEATWAVLVVSQLDDGAHEADDMDYDNARRFHYEAAAVVDTPAPEAKNPEVAPQAAAGDSGCKLVRGSDPGALVPLAATAVLAGVVSRRRRRRQLPT